MTLTHLRTLGGAAILSAIVMMAAACSSTSESETPEFVEETSTESAGQMGSTTPPESLIEGQGNQAGMEGNEETEFGGDSVTSEGSFNEGEEPLIEGETTPEFQDSDEAGIAGSEDLDAAVTEEPGESGTLGAPSSGLSY